VKVFNHLTTTDNTNVKSLYFLPYTLKTLPGLNPEDDFHTARSSKANRHAGTGCSTLNLKGQEKLTVIFGNTAG